MMANRKINQEEIDSLLNEVRILRRYRNLVRTQGKVLSALGGISTLVFLGPNLTDAISRWLTAKKKSSSNVPIEDTANLIAALARRVIRVGLIAITLALIPTALLFWQNLIMRDQYSALISQISEQRAQTENQQITSYFPLLLSNDRKKFWAAVSFFSSNETRTKIATSRLTRMLLESEGAGACSALEALARLSPKRKDGTPVHDITKLLIPLIAHNKIPIGGIEIKELECEGLKLRQTGISQLSLRKSNLKGSEFSYVDLSGTSFQKSDLRGARFLDGIEWTSEEVGKLTDFTGADLRYAFFEAELSNVILNDADLSGALFTWVTGKQLKKMPSIWFKRAHCLSPKEAEECHRWHLNNFRGTPQTIEKPSSCPDEIKHPIILVYGHEPERQDCDSWVSGG